MNMIERLMGNPYAWLFLALCTVASLFFAIYTWIKGKKTKEISIDNYTNEIVKMGKSPIKKLEMKFDGKAIQELSSTIYFLWNSGSDVINASDMVGKNPIKIICEDEQFLDVKILKQSDESNSFQITDFNAANIEMSFDYMDSGEGVKIQILHTGNVEKIQVEYKVKGGKPKRNCAELRKERGIKKVIKAIADELIPMFIWLFAVLMTALIVYIIGITGEGFLVITTIISVPLTLIMMFTFVKIKRMLKQIFHRTVPDALKNEEQIISFLSEKIGETN